MDLLSLSRTSALESGSCGRCWRRARKCVRRSAEVTQTPAKPVRDRRQRGKTQLEGEGKIAAGEKRGGWGGEGGGGAASESSTGDEEAGGTGSAQPGLELAPGKQHLNGQLCVPSTDPPLCL